MYVQLIITIFTVIIQEEKVLADDSEMRLFHDLTSNYGISIRPSQNISEPTIISITTLFRKVHDMGLVSQSLKTGWRILMGWNDYKLTWNISEYEGIMELKIPTKYIWIPDITLYNNIDPSSEDSIVNSLATVDNTGRVVIMKEGIFSSFCRLDISYFPFDVQTCDLAWSSWTFSVDQVDLILEENKAWTSKGEENSEFDLLSLTAKKHIFVTVAKKRTIPFIHCQLKLKRKSLIYVINFILPCSLISAIGLLVFYVPCLSGEKVTLGVSSVLSMAVFLMKIKESLPPTDKTPILNIYYVTSMCLVTFATGLSILNINVYHRGERGDTISKTFKLIINILSSFFLFPRTKDSSNKKIIKAFWKNKISAENDYFQNYTLNLLQRRPLQLGDTYEIGKQHLAYTILRYDDMLTYQETIEKENEENEKLKQEWKHASVVLDRFFLITFTLVTCLSSIAILFSRS